MGLNLNRHRGVTLAETTIAIGIMAVIFASMASLIFLTSRNAINVHDQIMSQTSCSAAGERAAQVLRNAIRFNVHTDDASSVTANARIPRIRFAMPDAGGNPATPQFGMICFDEKNDNPAIPGGEVQIFMRQSDVTFSTPTEPTGTPDYSFNRITGFDILYESDYRITLRMFYNYNGFALRERDSNRDGVLDNLQSGQFVTDVIAKNHGVGEGPANYGDDTTETTGIADLYNIRRSS